MNIDNLKPGMVIPNYKALCEALEIKPTSGDSKKAQLKSLRQYIDFHNKGYAFIIDDIYQTPRPKSDRRKELTNSIYAQHLELILLDYLARNTKNEFDTLQLTTNDIIEVTGMVNRKFGELTYYDLLSGNENITNFDYKDFMRRANAKFTEIVKSILYNLKSRFILNVKEGYIIIEENIIRNATNEEESKIIEIKKQILHEMGLRKIQDVYSKFLWKSFYSRVNELIKKYYGWDRCYQVYNLSFFKSSVQNSIENYKQEMLTMLSEKNKLNNKIINFIDNQAEKIYDKNIKSIETAMKEFEDTYWGDLDDYAKENKLKELFKLHPGYVDNQKYLSNILIKL